MGARMVSNLRNKVIVVLCNTWLWLQLAIQAADGPQLSKFSCRRLSILCLEGFDRQIMLVIFQCRMITVREIASIRPNFYFYFTLKTYFFLFYTTNFCQDICDLMLGTYVNLELANPLTKCTLLVIGQIQDVFNTSKNKSSSLVLKPCKFVQEISEGGLLIKVGQIPDKQLSIEVFTTA